MSFHSCKPVLSDTLESNMRKVRVIALYIQYRDGVPDEDRRRLYQHARLTLAEQDAVNALVHMGVRISRASFFLLSGTSGPKFALIKGPNDKDTKKKIKQKFAGDEYELSRFKPILRSVLEVRATKALADPLFLTIVTQDQIGDKLDAISFPYVKDAPMATPLSPRSPPPQTTSLRSQKPAWHRAPKAATVENRQRVLVFVAGGVTYSEMREVYNLSNSLHKDIFIGETFGE